MKRILVWILVFMLLGTFAACAGESPAAETTTVNSAVWEPFPTRAGFALEKLPEGDFVWAAQSMPFPKPPAERCLKKARAMLP